ncbi:hypothetical protein ACFLQU_04765 [Verrucomicrobiota bacterium]
MKYEIYSRHVVHISVVMLLVSPSAAYAHGAFFVPMLIGFAIIPPLLASLVFGWSIGAVQATRKLRKEHPDSAGWSRFFSWSGYFLAYSAILGFKAFCVVLVLEIAYIGGSIGYIKLTE